MFPLRRLRRVLSNQLPMDVDTKFSIVRSIGEECIEDAELKTLLAKKPQVVLYDGFEPSGRMHIAQGIFKAINVNKATSAGCKFIFWVADWFALMNNKIGGDIGKIRTIGRYFVEVWKAAGMNMENVEFRWASDSICGDAARYWPMMLDIARRFTLARVKKCCQIMGRTEGTLTAAQILYPLMQATDIFFLGADVCQLGLDQRKVNMLARQYAAQVKGRHRPIILSHHMLAGLRQGQAKMSKSDPDSAVFMEDAAEDVLRKITQAYCPPPTTTAAAAATADLSEAPAAAATAVDGDDDDRAPPATAVVNPVLDYVKCLCFGVPNAVFDVEGAGSFASYQDLEAAYAAGTVSADALRAALAVYVNARLQPVRDALAQPEVAGLLDEVRTVRAQLAAEEQVRAPPPPLAVPTVRVGAPLAGAVGDASGRTAVVLALPTHTPSLVAAVNALAAAKDLIACGAAVRVVVQSWTAVAANCFDGDLAGAEAAAVAWKECFAKLVAVAAVASPELADATKLSVVLEHELILGDVNDFWLAAIHTGRSVLLTDAEAALGIVEGENAASAAAGSVVASLPEASPVGLVVAALMSSAAFATPSPVAVVATHPLHLTAAKFLTSAVTHVSALATAGVADTAVAGGRAVTVVDATVSDKDDVGFTLWENEVTSAPKLKKAYCAPGDVGCNPPLLLLSQLAAAGLVSLPLVINRSAEHGGDVVFETTDAAQSAFASEALHPGDLKALAKTLSTDVRDRNVTRPPPHTPIPFTSSAHPSLVSASPRRLPCSLCPYPTDPYSITAGPQAAARLRRRQGRREGRH